MGRGVCTLHEPFNFHVGLRDVDRYFEIPGTSGFSTEQLSRRIDGIRNLRMRFKPGVFPEDRGLRRALKHIVGGRSRASYRLCRLQPGLETIVWKDPFACFCADVLTDVHGIPVVVTVRNPWAGAASFKRMGWRFDVRDILARAAEANLFEPDWESLAARELDNPTINAAVLWNAVYGALLRQSGGRAIHLVNLDDILEHPLGAYAQLYAGLSLQWSDHVAGKISEMYESRSQRVLPREKRAHDRKRDLSSINRYWKELLGEEEAEAVGDLTGLTWERIQAACLTLEPAGPAGEGTE